jgi:hypothetical protein
MGILFYALLIITIIMQIYYRSLIRDFTKVADDSIKGYNSLFKVKTNLEDELYETKDKLHNALVILGEIPIKNFDLKGKYHNSEDCGLHNISIIQLPDSKFQIIALKIDGLVKKSATMGIVATEQEVLDYMNKAGYVKLRDF